MNRYNTALEQHYDSIWHCHDNLKLFDAGGRIKTINQDFKILEIMPDTARPVWTYATLGMAGEDGDADIELHVFSDIKNIRWVEILESIAYFHLTEVRFGISHTVNFGVEVIKGSDLTHGLISLPYIDGPKLQDFSYGIQKVSCFWLIPITESELQYKKKYGLEELERLFEKSAFSYSDPMRSSVI
jgi:hypothetical protein